MAEWDDRYSSDGGASYDYSSPVEDYDDGGGCYGYYYENRESSYEYRESSYEYQPRYVPDESHYLAEYHEHGHDREYIAEENVEDSYYSEDECHCDEIDDRVGQWTEQAETHYSTGYSSREDDVEGRRNGAQEACPTSHDRQDDGYHSVEEDVDEQSDDEQSDHDSVYSQENQSVESRGQEEDKHEDSDQYDEQQTDSEHSEQGSEGCQEEQENDESSYSDISSEESPSEDEDNSGSDISHQPRDRHSRGYLGVRRSFSYRQTCFVSGQNQQRSREQRGENRQVQSIPSRRSAHGQTQSTKKRVIPYSLQGNRGQAMGMERPIPQKLESWTQPPSKSPLGNFPPVGYMFREEIWKWQSIANSSVHQPQRTASHLFPIEGEEPIPTERPPKGEPQYAHEFHRGLMTEATGSHEIASRVVTIVPLEGGVVSTDLVRMLGTDTSQPSNWPRAATDVAESSQRGRSESALHLVQSEPSQEDPSLGQEGRARVKQPGPTGSIKLGVKLREVRRKCDSSKQGL